MLFCRREVRRDHPFDMSLTRKEPRIFWLKRCHSLWLLAKTECWQGCTHFRILQHMKTLSFIYGTLKLLGQFLSPVLVIGIHNAACVQNQGFREANAKQDSITRNNSDSLHSWHLTNLWVSGCFKSFYSPFCDSILKSKFSNTLRAWRFL